MRDKLIALGIIVIIIILGYIAVIHNINTNTWVKFEGTIIDKYTEGGWSGALYCLIQVDEERYKTSYNCEDYIVGDKVNIQLKINNGDGKKTISYLYGR